MYGKPICKSKKLQGGHHMFDILFWNVFEKSGNIEAYLLYKDFERHYSAKKMPSSHTALVDHEKEKSISNF